MRRWLTALVVACVLAGGSTAVSTYADAKPKPALAAVTDGQLNVLDCGATPGGTGNDTAAFQSCINLVHTAYPRRGDTILIPSGVYDVDVNSLTFPTMAIRFVGVASVGANALDVGAKIRATGPNGTLFAFGGSAVVVTQAGPTFENVALDGGGFAGVTGVSLRMVNRARFLEDSFSNLAVGVKIDTSADTISGGDSSWHTFEAPHFYVTGIGIDARHSYGLTITGGDFVGATTGIRWGVIGNNPSQWLRVFGTKFDGGTIAVDVEGGLVVLDGAAFERAGTAVKVRKPIANSISGSYVDVTNSTWSGNLAGQVGVDVGAGAHDVSLTRTHSLLTGAGSSNLVDASGGGVTVV